MIWVTCLTGFVLLAAGVTYLWVTTPIPKPSDVAVSQSTDVLFSDGSLLGTIGKTHRTDVLLSQVPVPVRQAVLAAEDRKFYSEPGISITGIARAVLVDATGGAVQGGSTITQQYAKNAYLTQKRTLSRKLREAVIAVKLSQQRSHDSVLQDYLNTIYFGRGASGIEEASKAYFGKDVGKLNAAEGAVLAAVINRPSYLDPDVHPAAAKLRYDYVMKGMVKEGWLPAALPFPKDVIKYTPARVTGPNAFVLDAVQKEVAAHVTDENALAAGTVIVTTIDKNAQAAAIKAEDDKLNNVVKGSKSDDPPVSALVAMQPTDGAIRAMYGGQGSTDGDCSVRKGGCLNLATQGLFQPGSSFKPYVLAAAESTGTAGILTRMNGPAVLPDPPGPDVHNDSGEVCNNCQLDTALAQSINTIYVPLAKKVTPSVVATIAHSVGIPESVPLLDAGLTTDRIALGVYPVHPIDQAVGYATLCNGGRSVTPFLVRSVKTRKGDSLYSAAPKATARIDPKVAADVTFAMQQVVTSGTAKAAALGDRPVAGKTGTTQNNTNAWFIGCTGPAKNNGQLVTAVWIGHAAKVAPLTDIPGFEKGVFGGTLPAQIFQEFMSTAMNGKPVVAFPPPAYFAGPKPASTVSATPTTTSASPSPSKSTASPKPTKTKPTTVAPTTTAPTTSAAPVTSAAPPPPSQVAPTTTAAAPPASGAPAAGVTSPAAAGVSGG